jgi:hypothetical protein
MISKQATPFDKDGEVPVIRLRDVCGFNRR